jgi:hypothetical protein
VQGDSIITNDVTVAPEVASSATRMLSSLSDYDPSAIVIPASLNPQKMQAPSLCPRSPGLPRDAS